ncbi:MAG TPA: hypothetical protein VKW08_08110 [Xanthobacteraceae bacterium]|nr:hypothetical protein [Xanthobacteraceae bacterium]
MALKAPTDAIVALLRERPGLTAREIEAHFSIEPSGCFNRLIKLAARGILRVEVESRSFHRDPRGRCFTTGAQTRRYFAPPILEAAE